MTAMHEPIAVVGLACRFPGAPSIASFDQLLRDGRHAIREIPEGRWNLDALRGWNGGAALPRSATHGGWLDTEAVHTFDAAFFRMSPREARTLDPKQRLALEVTHEALEDARLAPSLLEREHTVGVFLGTAQSEYLMRFYFRGEVVGPGSDRYSGPGNDASFSSGRISRQFGLTGPSLNVNTACSTTLVTVHEAMRAIASGDCDVAVAGGVAIVESPEHSLVMAQFGVLSPDARCWTFDARANGYVRGEGCGMVVLRRLSDALAHGDRIHAVLEGSAVNHNGASEHLLAPDADAQVRLLRRTLQVAGVEPDAVDVVEAHGTGTGLGDPIEVRALASVFASGRSRPLHVASVKTNIGHLEVGAGIAGLIKTVLSVRDAHMPAHLGLETLNPGIDPGLPFAYPTVDTPWPTTPGPRRAVVNSFGISGINAAVCVAQAPAPMPPPDAPGRGTALLPVSAVGDTPLRALADAYADRLAEGSDWHALAFTAATGRDPLARRLLVHAADASTAEAALRAVSAGGTHPSARVQDAPGRAPRVAWLFTGQGAQTVGMGRALYASESAFREAYDAVDAAMRPHLGRSIRAVTWGEDPEASIDDTTWTQPAMVALQIALARSWQAAGVAPDIMVGHSIGEIAAAHVAGVLDLDDAAALVAARGRLMGALPRDGAMAAVFASVDEVAAVVAQHPGVDIAADNGPKATVISGLTSGVDAVVAHFDAADVVTRRLTVSHAFHSGLMEPMLAPFREVVEGLTLRVPTGAAVFSTLTGRVETDALATVDHWVQHVRAPVRFREGVSTLSDTADLVIELGPSTTLLAMARRMLRRAPLQWVASQDAERPAEAWLDALGGAWLAGVAVDWERVHEQHRTPRIPLPAYPFQRREHWIADPGPQGGSTRPATPDVASAPTSNPRLYRPQWRPVQPSWGPSEPTGTWLVVEDEGGVAAAIAGHLEAAGHTVVRMPAGSVADDGALDAVVAQHTATLRGVLHAAALDTAGASAVDVSQHDRAGLGALQLAQAVLRHAPNALAVLLTAGAQPVLDDEVPDAAQAGAWGVARVVALEHPALRQLRVDVAGDAAHAVASLLLTPPTDEDQLAWRHDGWHGLRLTPHAPTTGPLAPSPGRSWVITGGLGSLGLAVAGWLSGQGVTHLVLAGRSAPSEVAVAALKALEAAGTMVSVVAADVSVQADVQRLVQAATSLAPLGGIVHAAGVLADGPVLQTDRSRFLSVHGPKVLGAWWLHEATLDHDLEAFVLFSSVTAILGAPGQVNYASANAFLDAFAHQRRALGKPAVSIDWGPWGEIGMAARLSSLMLRRGMVPLDTAPALAILGRIASGDAPQVVVMDLQIEQLAATQPAFLSAPLTRALLPATLPSGATHTTAADDPLAVLASVAPASRLARLTLALAAEAERLLGVEPGDVVPDRPLAWQGFDSVLAIDLNVALKEAYQVGLPQERITTGPSVTELATALLPLLTLPDEAVPLPAAPAVTTSATHAAPADVVTWLAAQAEALLGYEPGEIKVDQPLAWQGFDSVMAVDLHHRILDGLGVDLGLDTLVSGPRLTELAARLGGATVPSGLTPSAPMAPAPVAAPAAPPPSAPAPAAPGPEAPEAPDVPYVWIALAFFAGAALAGLAW